MKSKRSARLGFAAAVWLVLSVAVFGTLIGIAWMSMSATVDDSTDAVVVDAVEEAGSTQDVDFVSRDRTVYYTPASEGDSTLLNPFAVSIPKHFGVYYTPT
ncbi:MAG: hypothetical protein ACXABX_03020 [Candidatus Thorarchaeota archaeon]|jgi:hypothetical protein